MPATALSIRHVFEGTMGDDTSRFQEELRWDRKGKAVLERQLNHHKFPKMIYTVTVPAFITCFLSFSFTQDFTASKKTILFTIIIINDDS